MASETAGVAVAAPTDVGFKRELGLIGATWASETSIIGSGWLFGALYASQAVGGASVLAWVIVGVIVIVLALAHAELGAMYPVSGGTARFPHFAFGSVAGIGFGFFSYVQAVTIAPIECFAFMQYAAHFWPSIYDSDEGQRHRGRLRADHRADGDLRRGQLPGHAHLRPGQQHHHVVEGRDPCSHHHRAGDPLAQRQLHGRRRASCRAGSTPCSPRCPPRASSSPTPASSSATSSPGEIKNPGRNLPRAIIYRRS